MQLLLFHDFASPFSRLAFAVAAPVVDAAGASLTLLPFELRPAPAPLPPPDADAVRGEITRASPLADQLGIELRPPRGIPRTLKAHEAVEVARLHGAECDLAARIYDALWVDGIDIGRVDVLAGLAEKVGLNGHEVHVALGLDTHAAKVASAVRAAGDAGVDAVPAFVLAGRTLFGAVSQEELASWLRGA